MTFSFLTMEMRTQPKRARGQDSLFLEERHYPMPVMRVSVLLWRPDFWFEDRRIY
jgi:hypothetical protein